MALIGSPVGHSGSPAMYNFSFRYHNLWTMLTLAFDIKKTQVPAALGCNASFKMRGANVNYAIVRTKLQTYGRAFTGCKIYRC